MSSHPIPKKQPWALRLSPIPIALMFVTCPPAWASYSAQTAILKPSPTVTTQDRVASPPAATPAAPLAKPGAAAQAPVIIRIGTSAVMTIREPLGPQSVADRAAVVQSRIDQVLLHHPYLTWTDIKLLSEHGAPTIYWGQFPILAVDEVHAHSNHYSNADLLAHAWANSLRAAVKAFFLAKKMPGRALWRTPGGNVYTYRHTDRTLSQPTLLVNTRYVFSPKDFEWGPGVKEAGQSGFVVFIRKDASHPPAEIYLGNGQGTFTAYDWIRPEDTP